MALEADFLAMASTTVTHAALSTYTTHGAPQYSTSTTTYTAAVEYSPRLVVNTQGREEIASATVYVMSSSATIGVQDQLSLGDSTSVRIIRVDKLNDDEGQHHLEVSIA